MGFTLMKDGVSRALVTRLAPGGVAFRLGVRTGVWETGMHANEMWACVCETPHPACGLWSCLLQTIGANEQVGQGARSKRLCSGEAKLLESSGQASRVCYFVFFSSALSSVCLFLSGIICCLMTTA